MKKLRFCTNKQLDEIMIEQFLHEQGGGIDFGKGVIKLHPRLKLAKSLENVEQKKKIIHLYIHKYYHSHKEEINYSIKNLQKAWHKKEKEFVIETKENGKENVYIQSISVNGKDQGTTFVPFRDVISGGRMVITLGNVPKNEY